MATLRQINRRIRSVQSTAKTTRAMSLVAGSKMRRAQQMALAQRPYAEQLHWLLADVVESIQSKAGEGEALHPLLDRREIKSHGLILLTPDRGLCGGLNTNLLRVGGNFVTSHENVKFIGVGRKGNDFFRRLTVERLGEFSRLGDYPSYDDILPIARLVTDAYISGEVDSVSIVYPNFINTVLQRPATMELLPVTLPEHAMRSFEPMPQVNCCASATAFIGPLGGGKLRLQHSMVPPVVMTHTSLLAASREETTLPGGWALPAPSWPQHATVSSERIAHTWLGPPVSFANTPLGTFSMMTRLVGLKRLPQHAIVPDVRSAHA